MLSHTPHTVIGSKIVQWFDKQGRDLPWRDTRDPYLIWISEVILQQTRIETGIAYYYRFIERFPNVQALAKAELDEVLKYWEGLGYYSRARNLHAASRHIVGELAGQFPNHHTELIKLKGVGPYTARAIGSFAFGNQTGVIDGNVLRVMSRILGDFSPIDQQKTRKSFQHIIDQWVEGVDSRSFNNGIMDIGSTICTPSKPACLICPLEAVCKARQEGIIHLLPYKEKKLKRKIRFFHFYLVINREGEFVIRQRPTEGLWGGLWEIPNEEVDQKQWKVSTSSYGGPYLFGLKHVFTHFDMMIRVYQLADSQSAVWEGCQFISTEKIATFAFARAVLKIFEQWQNTV
ncbi:MAG: A/G-specific adenine glycosylase [Bacteroidota bacterium]